MTRLMTVMMMSLLCLGGCAFEEVFPALELARAEVLQAGSCVKFKCDLPLANCRVRPGTCR